jgi:hypothetical protein
LVFDQFLGWLTLAEAEQMPSGARDLSRHCSSAPSGLTLSLSISVGLLFLGILLNLVRSLFIFLTDFVELLHVFEKVGASLQSDEKFGFLAVATVVGGLHGNGFSSDLLEGCVFVSTKTHVSIGQLKLERQKAHTLSKHSLAVDNSAARKRQHSTPDAGVKSDGRHKGGKRWDE